MDGMSEESLEDYEAELELQLYREYRDVVALFRYVVETERRTYLANAVSLTPHTEGSDMFTEIQLEDAWVWDMYRSKRFVKKVRVVSFKDVHVEELPGPEELGLPDGSLG